MSRLALLALVAVWPLASGCSDSSSAEGPGWQFNESVDGGDATDVDEADAPERPEDTGPDEPDTREPDADPPRCPSGELPDDDGVCDTMLLTGAEWGQAFNDDQMGSSWAVATIYIDGRVELGAEQIFNEETPMVTANSGPRSYLIPESGNRVVVLDAADGFFPLGDISVGPVDLPAEEVILQREVAFLAGASRGYMAFYHPSPMLAVLDEANGRVEDSYIDWGPVLGESAFVEAIAADGPDHLIGIVTKDNDTSYAFGFSAAGSFLVEQQDGTDLVELPRKAQGVDILRTPGGHVVLDLAPMSATQGISGGLFRIERLAPGRYRADDYLITSEQLGGNPNRLAMSAERQGVAQIDGENGSETVFFSADADSPQVHTLDVPRVRGLCASPDQQRVWMATAEGYYEWRASQPRQVRHVAGAELSYKPKRCAFGR